MYSKFELPRNSVFNIEFRGKSLRPSILTNMETDLMLVQSDSIRYVYMVYVFCVCLILFGASLMYQKVGFLLERGGGIMAVENTSFQPLLY